MRMGGRAIHIQLHRYREVVATCPSCGNKRRMGTDWRERMRASLSAERAAQWDGQLRCRQGGHQPAVMTLADVVNTRFEADGSVVIHRPAADDARLAACTRAEWAVNYDQIMPGTILANCTACARLTSEGNG